VKGEILKSKRKRMTPKLNISHCLGFILNFYEELTYYSGAMYLGVPHLKLLLGLARSFAMPKSAILNLTGNKAMSG
jgi:hypothetical protein